MATLAQALLKVKLGEHIVHEIEESYKQNPIKSTGYLQKRRLGNFHLRVSGPRL